MTIGNSDDENGEICLTENNVLDTADRDASQVHLDQSLFYTAFAATVALDDSRLEGPPFEFRHLQRDIA